MTAPTPKPNPRTSDTPRTSKESENKGLDGWGVTTEDEGTTELLISIKQK